MKPRQWQPPFMPKPIIEQKCERFRAEHCAGYDFPLDVDLITEKEVKLDLIPVSGIRSARVSAFLKSDFSGIVVDLLEFTDERYDARMRFSIAHELGHYVMHQDLYKQFHIETIKDYIDFILGMEEGAYRSVEFQANWFAATLLTPRTALVSELARARKESSNQIPADYQTDPELSLIWIAPKVARKFGVSFETIERRIKEEGLSKKLIE